LRRAEICEAFLQGMGPPVLHHTFHRDDLGFFRFDAEHQTGKHGLPVNQHSTSAALSQLASMFGAGETHILAQDFQQRLIDLRGDLFGFAVDAELQQRFG
jgi:hypothetical protein